MYHFLKLISRILGSLSDRSTLALASFLTFLGFDVCRFRRQVVFENLTRVYGDSISQERKSEIAHKAFKNFILTVLEFFRSLDVDIAGRVKIEGMENLKPALAEGKGVYVLCFHMGNWEAFAAAASRQVTPAHIIVKKVGSDNVDKFVDELRAHNGMRYIKRKVKGDGMKAMIKALDANEIVAFVMDQARPGEPRFDFFGHPAKTNTSMAAIWRRHPAPVLVGYVVRESLGVHTARFLPKMDLHVTDDLQADIANLTKAFNSAIEPIIRDNPEHYLWMHNRWK